MQLRCQTAGGAATSYIAKGKGEWEGQGCQPKLACKACGGDRLAAASQLTSNLQIKMEFDTLTYWCPYLSRSCIVCPRIDPRKKRGALPDPRLRLSYLSFGDAVEGAFLFEAYVPAS